MTDTAAPPAPPAVDPAVTAVEGAVGALLPVLNGLDRGDLAQRATAAAARLKRPATIVCIVGEFKQGKSSLVNGLLGQDLCPVDDDLATSALTLVRYGDELGAVVRRKEGDQAVAERVAPTEVGRWATEQGNPGNAQNVERVEISAPSAMLRQGLVLVDTPGMGGLGAGHAAATLSFLPFADGLVLVSDASQELTAPELAFLRQAAELCPTVLVAQTKIDLYPGWQRIVDLNKGHLAKAGLDLPVVAVSSVLRSEAMSRRDRELNEASRFPSLIAALGEEVIDPAKASAASRSVADVRGIAAMVRTGLEQQQATLADPASIARSLDDLNRAKERIEHLRGPGARWGTIVNDRISDVSNKVNFDFRGATRKISRDMDERIEALTNGSAWDEMARDLQAAVATEVTAAFVAIEQARGTIAAEVADLIQEEHLALPGPVASGRAVDLASLWHGKDVGEKGSKAGKAAKTGLTGIRGAQSGVMMFGMMGTFLPAAAATLIASNPVLLGAGAIFGGMQLGEERKRKVQVLRQTARHNVRQFLDDVQFEVGNAVADVIRELQRDLRDGFTERLGELQRTYAESAKAAQEDAQRSQGELDTRKKQVAATLDALSKVDAALQGVPR
jgi:hypothetical protein